MGWETHKLSIDRSTIYALNRNAIGYRPVWASSVMSTEVLKFLINALDRNGITVCAAPPPRYMEGVGDIHSLDWQLIENWASYSFVFEVRFWRDESNSPRRMIRVEDETPLLSGAPETA